MDRSVAIEAVLDNLPVAELEQSLSDFISPFAAVLPDARLRQVVPLALRGIVAGESPVVTAMAQGVAQQQQQQQELWAVVAEEYDAADKAVRTLVLR